MALKMKHKQSPLRSLVALCIAIVVVVKCTKSSWGTMYYDICPGRAPLICKWEQDNFHFNHTQMSPEQEKSLNLTIAMQQKGKNEKAQKMYEKLLYDDANPFVLYSFALFHERNLEDYPGALHYYIYSLHQQYDRKNILNHYYTVLNQVTEYETQLFLAIDDQIKWAYSINLEENDAMIQAIRDIKNQKRLEYVYHTNALEGCTVTLEDAKALIETGIARGQYHLYELNEIWGGLESYNFVSALALQTYRSEVLELEDGIESCIHQSLIMDHHHLLELPFYSAQPIYTVNPEIMDSHPHSHSNQKSFSHLPWYAEVVNDIGVFHVLQIHKRVFGRVKPEYAG
jgi:hypothetical protein